MANPLLMHDLLGEDDALDEFAPVARQERINASLAIVRPTDGALSPRKINEITKARVRAMCTDIVAGEMENVKKALHDVLADNPKVYLDQLMAFMEFSTPKLKAMELDVSDNRESTKAMTIDELQRALAETRVVSTQ